MSCDGKWLTTAATEKRYVKINPGKSFSLQRGLCKQMNGAKPLTSPHLPLNWHFLKPPGAAPMPLQQDSEKPKCPKEMPQARPHLRDAFFLLLFPRFTDDLFCLSFCFPSPPIPSSTAPSLSTSALPGSLGFPLLVSVTCLSGPLHNSPFVFPKC